MTSMKVIHTQCRCNNDRSKSAETLQNTRYTMVWVKISSAVPEAYKDLLRSWYNMFWLYSSQLCSAAIGSASTRGADLRLHRHLAHAFLAKYYDVYHLDINIATRYDAWLSRDWSDLLHSIAGSRQSLRLIRQKDSVYTSSLSLS